MTTPELRLAELELRAAFAAALLEVAAELLLAVLADDTSSQPQPLPAGDDGHEGQP